MAANSSFLSRFSLSRDASPVLPLHTKPLRHKPSEYDLEELEPRPEESLLFAASDPDPTPAFLHDPLPAKAAGPSSVSSFAYRDAPSSPRASSSGNQNDHDYDKYDDNYERSPPPPSSTRRPKPHHVLFDGPPPPIATSVLMFRDVEDRGSSVGGTPGQRRRRGGDHLLGGAASSSSSIRLPTNTVFLDPRRAPSAGQRTINKVGAPLDGDSTWTILQRRERALQREIQTFLDVQSAGLSAGLGRGPLNPSPSAGASSDGGGGGGGGGSRTRSRNRSRSSRSNTPTAERSSSLRLPTDRATAAGAVIPVRQPRPRRLGLRAARAGLARSIALLADLKAEEDASLAAALRVRKRALAHLRALAGRRGDIARALRALEADDADEPLTRELATLRSAHASTGRQIAELEGQLAMLRQRQRTLEGRIEDAASQREAGLSGYRGALREVEAQLSAVLRRPPIQPLDGIQLDSGGQDGDDSSTVDDDASGGVEFLRLLPERRTAEMARFWWETEIRLLERRKAEVDTEKAALDEGGAVWLEAVQLVSNFEADLRKEMAVGQDGGADGDEDEDEDGPAKGKARAPTPEEKMRGQLQKMAAVIAGLRTHLRTAEAKGWNLLICAIGAELEAFQEARNMLQQALREAGLVVDDDDAEDEADAKNIGSNDNNLIDGDGFGTSFSTTAAAGPRGVDEFEDSAATPRLARSTSDAPAAKSSDHGFHRESTASESDDNDVPPELLVTHEREIEEHEGSSSSRGRRDHHDKDDSSENEVPLEFLSEQQTEGSEP